MAHTTLKGPPDAVFLGEGDGGVVSIRVGDLSVGSGTEVRGIRVEGPVPDWCTPLKEVGNFGEVFIYKTRGGTVIGRGPIDTSGEVVYSGKTHQFVRHGDGAICVAPKPDPASRRPVQSMPRLDQSHVTVSFPVPSQGQFRSQPYLEPPAYEETPSNAQVMDDADEETPKVVTAGNADILAEAWRSEHSTIAEVAGPGTTPLLFNLSFFSPSERRSIRDGSQLSDAIYAKIRGGGARVWTEVLTALRRHGLSTVVEKLETKVQAA